MPGSAATQASAARPADAPAYATPTVAMPSGGGVYRRGTTTTGHWTPCSTRSAVVPSSPVFAKRRPVVPSTTIPASSWAAVSVISAPALRPMQARTSTPGPASSVRSSSIACASGSEPCTHCTTSGERVSRLQASPNSTGPRSPVRAL